MFNHIAVPPHLRMESMSKEMSTCLQVLGDYSARDDEMMKLLREGNFFVDLPNHLICYRDAAKIYAIIAFDTHEDQNGLYLRVRQIQGARTGVQPPLGWQQMLLEAIIACADSQTVYQVEVVPARLNPWWSERYHQDLTREKLGKLRGRLMMHYDRTAQRCGFKMATQQAIANWKTRGAGSSLVMPTHTKAL